MRGITGQAGWTDIYFRKLLRLVSAVIAAEKSGNNKARHRAII
jgi:hypothetical protein